MSVFTETITALTSVVPPLHQRVADANTAMNEARNHLAEALDHLGRDFQQALQDKASAEAALGDASKRVEELKAAALHLASVGQSVENLLGIGQQVVEHPEDIPSEIPQVVNEVQNVIHETEAAAESAGKVLDFPTITEFD